LKLSLEYQGDQHRTDRAQWQRDIARTRALQAEGWTELQFTQADLDDPARFLTELRTILERLSR
jgi:very-short-patch-repair endonuclease